MKILFVTFFNDESYGVRILHSILSKEHQCYILFIKDDNKELIIESIKNINPDVLGISLVSPYFQLYKKLYKDIRNIGNFKILLGGWHSTLNPKECCEYCDILCQGEGESIIKDIINDIENNKYKKIYFASLAKDIDYPSFIFDNEKSYCIENGKIIQKEPYYENERYGTMIGRGCPHSCTYCSNSYMKNLYPNWNKIRYREIDKVLQELIEVKKNLKNVKRINFYDEVFSLRRDKLDYFLINYKKEIDLPFYCMFYPGMCNEEMAKKLNEFGLKGVWLGVQSGSEKIRKEIFKRHYTNEKVLKQIQIFEKFNIDIRCDFIFENPFESEEDQEKTLELISKFPSSCSLNMFQLKFFPNTEITNMAIEKGIIKKYYEEENYNIDTSYLISKEKQQIIKEKIERIRKYK